MKKLFPSFFLIFLGIISSFYLLSSRNNLALAELATHIVISEVQVEGANPALDFIEIYNPTDSPVSLAGHRLIKVASTGTESDIEVFTAEDIIPAHGYRLWCNNGLNALLGCDESSADSISDNNSIAIRNGDLITGTLIDAVTFGSPIGALGEGTSLTAPSALTSVERKANSLSTSETMASTGIDELMGNGEDSNDNATDFVARSNPQAQSNDLGIEPAITPTATEEPTASPSPTEEITPTPTLSPTATPTLSPSPTQEPTPTPTNEPTPTATPTDSPTPTISVSPTPTVTPSVFPTPTPKVIFEGRKLTCSLNYKAVRFFGKTIYLPHITCVRS